MIDKDVLIRRAGKIEDRLLLSRILDKAVKTENSSEVTHTDFLDPYQRKLVEKTLSDISEVSYDFNGGYEGAEREIIVFRPNFMSEYLDYENFLKVLKVGIKGRNSPSHRDYLGSLMGLGIKREKIGDILVGDKSCDIIVLSDVAEYLKYNLTKVGNTKVKADICNLDCIQVPETKVKEINTTVASLRLDCVSSAGFGISRSKASQLIKAEKLYLNWELSNSLNKQVKEGDVITIRGKGRIEVSKVGGKTRKDRINILLKKFV